MKINNHFKKIIVISALLLSSIFPSTANAQFFNYGSYDTTLRYIEEYNIANGRPYGNFSCTVTAAQSGSSIIATVNVNGDLDGFNRLGWKLNHGGTTDNDVSDIISSSTTYPKSFTFATAVTAGTLYRITSTFYSVNILTGNLPGAREGIGCETTFTTDPGTLENIKILGKIPRTSTPGLEACPDGGRYYYGDNCGNAACYGAPNFTVRWQQGINSKTLPNNECFNNSPRYTFEHVANPQSNKNGKDVTLTVNMDSGVLLTGWVLNVSDANGNDLPGTRQAGYFSTPGPNQTITVKTYKDGEYQWNHLWFYYVDRRNQAECQSITAPGSVYAGQAFTGTVAMKNSGTTTWSEAAAYRLGSQDAKDNTTWGFNRVTSANAIGFPVSPGNSSTFTINATAPAVSGTYDFNWQMIQDGVGWFGQTCKKKITVVAMPTPTPTPISPYLGSGSLKIRENNMDSPAGVVGDTYGLSGLRSVDPGLSSGIAGKNYYNSLRVNIGVNNGTSSNVGLVGVAFTGNRLVPKSLSALMNAAKNDNGFIALYANQDKTVGFNTFLAGKYYVYFKNSSGVWGWTGGYNVGSAGFRDPALGLAVSLLSTPGFPAGPNFNVTLYQPLGNHTWNTYGFLMDNRNYQTIIKLSPSS